eukprot:5924677-Pleurochrysis_carterae.AAC.2
MARKPCAKTEVRLGAARISVQSGRSSQLESPVDQRKRRSDAPDGETVVNAAPQQFRAGSATGVQRLHKSAERKATAGTGRFVRAGLGLRQLCISVCI